MKETSIKSLRKGQLFSLPVKHKDGSIHAHLFKRGKWCGHIHMWSDEKKCFEERKDFFEALNPFTGSKEIIISSSSNIWKL